ncbi:venom protease-like [Homarus americanus]|uniref:limulus clotting factor C n=1 Tax=Homarus americanus TaxID=6706 RepID=A0A8J5NCE2_HOMAM|nr:venom protease-like [Homarus americanus]KAG7177755.1 Clotting factor B-like 1 [Homarus americanus]
MNVCLLLLAVVSATVVQTWAEGVLFEPRSNTDTCTLDTGGTGRCVDVRECPPVAETIGVKMPVLCGFNDKYPIVCCPIPVDVVAEPSLDYSPPHVSFDCGVTFDRTVPLSYALGFTSDSNGKILRPGHNLTGLSFPGLLTGLTPGVIPTGVIPSRLPTGLTPGGRFQKRSLAPVNTRPPIDPDRPVVGGKTSNINAWPWMALLGEKKKNETITWFCAGALINEYWVLTAYHCFLFEDINIVRLGEHDYNTASDEAVPKDYTIDKVVLHPEFKFPASYHDLALVKLDRQVIIQGHIRPVCLPWGEDTKTQLEGQKVTLTGWGNTAYGGSRSSALQEVEVTVFPTPECEKSYSDLRDYPFNWPRGLGDEVMCAGDKAGGRDACQGDSGGPIVTKDSSNSYTLAGIVSYGYGCGKKKYPGLYVNVRHLPYLSWIKSIAFK